VRHYDLPPLGTLEAFEAAARTLSFTKAADELSLTQSAISRQIQALEEHYGFALFRRLHRALELTEEGQTLYQAAGEILGQLHEVSARLQRRPEARTVIVTTTPGFAGIWLIPRLASFTALHPDVDVRISAQNEFSNLNRDGIDVAVRYHTREGVGEGADLLFGEVIFPVCSPRLARDPARPLKKPEDLRQHTLLHMETSAATVLQSWSMWLRALKLEGLAPAGSLHFSAYDQLIQAALAGQGVALGRSPLIDALLRDRRLVAPFRQTLASPRSYFVVQTAAASRKAEVHAFVAWLHREARADAEAGGRAPAGRAAPPLEPLPAPLPAPAGQAGAGAPAGPAPAAATARGRGSGGSRGPARP
jgi:DNA-binding transcriptional LysR family regulator